MKDKNADKYRRFGISVGYFRRLKGLTQEQLAEKMDVHVNSVRKIENAGTGTSSDMLFELSKALGVSLGELFDHAKL